MNLHGTAQLFLWSRSNMGEIRCLMGKVNPHVRDPRKTSVAAEGKHIWCNIKAIVGNGPKSYHLECTRLTMPLQEEDVQKRICETYFKVHKAGVTAESGVGYFLPNKYISVLGEYTDKAMAIPYTKKKKGGAWSECPYSEYFAATEQMQRHTFDYLKDVPEYEKRLNELRHCPTLQILKQIAGVLGEKFRAKHHPPNLSYASYCAAWDM